jgi:hypothetical protein
VDGIYHGLSEQERTVVLPDIKKGKTLYWIWGDEVMPVVYRGVRGGRVTYCGKFHIYCEIRTKKKREFPHTYKGESCIYVAEKGCKREFYVDDIGKTIFFTRKEAETALKETED